MAKRRWSQGAQTYAFTALVVFGLLAWETDRLWQAWNARGSLLVAPLLIATSSAAVTVAVLWWLVRSFFSEQGSRAWAGFCLGVVLLWSLAMFGLVVATHRARGVRLFYEAFDRPDTGVQFAAVAYQALVWVGVLVAMAVFARRWYLAGGFTADTEA